MHIGELNEFPLQERSTEATEEKMDITTWRKIKQWKNRKSRKGKRIENVEDKKEKKCLWKNMLMEK